VTSNVARIHPFQVLLPGAECGLRRDCLVESASRLPDHSLRSLDAIHLATALLLRDDLEVIVTYDKRLATVAEAHHLPVDSPGVAAHG
jgi:predicted nucleic acid-binding protein